MRKLIAFAGIAATFAVAAPAAQADIGDQLDAGDAVQAKLDKKYPTWTWISSCRNTSRKTFSCQISGFKTRGSHFATGRANVTKTGTYGFKVTIVSLNF